MEYKIKKWMGRFFSMLLVYIVLFGLAFMILFPYFTKIVTSLMSQTDLIDPTVMYIPRNVTLNIWYEAIDTMNLLRSYGTSIYISLATAVIQMFVCAFVGYGFARFKFPGSNILFLLVIFTMLVPFTTVILPYYLRFRFFNLFFMEFNLINTVWPNLILSVTGLGLKNGLYIYIFRQYFRGMPKELEEAAYIDGAGRYKTFLQVMLPNARASLLAVFLFAFCWQWTDTTYARTFFSTLPTVVNGVANVTRAVIREPAVYASAMIDTSSLLVIFPIAVVYLLLQRYFIQGIERSGITS